jgi:hypothetical protein
MKIKKKFGVFVHVTIDTDNKRVLFEIAGRKAYFPLQDITMNLEKEGFTSWELNVASGSLKEEFELREETGLEIIDWVQLAQTDLNKLIEIHQAEKEEKEKVKTKANKKKPLKTWQKVAIWIGAIVFLAKLLF